jgi:hypothetical protein
MTRRPCGVRGARGGAATHGTHYPKLNRDKGSGHFWSHAQHDMSTKMPATLVTPQLLIRPIMSPRGLLIILSVLESDCSEPVL